jgi:uncharacterized membrane protein YhaH (DUF805 family)
MLDNFLKQGRSGGVIYWGALLLWYGLVVVLLGFSIEGSIMWESGGQGLLRGVARFRWLGV